MASGGAKGQKGGTGRPGRPPHPYPGDPNEIDSSGDEKNPDPQRLVALHPHKWDTRKGEVRHWDEAENFAKLKQCVFVKLVLMPCGLKEPKWMSLS